MRTTFGCDCLKFAQMHSCVFNAAKRSIGLQHQYIRIHSITDDRPRDLASWKISNGQISTTGDPIHFMFGFNVELSEPDGSNGATSG